MIPEKCCFCMPLKSSVILIGFLSMTVSFVGILVSASSVLNYLVAPVDPLSRWLLRVCYFLDAHGIVFHTILFIVSTVMAFGAISNVPPLLVPWLGWSPFLLTCVLIQMSMVVIQQSDAALPVVLFGVMIFLFVIYGATVVAAYYKEVNKFATVQLRLFSIREGELPRIVEVPRQLFAHFHKPRDATQIVVQDAPTSSTTPLRQPLSSDPQATEMGRKLTSAYSRFLAATRWSDRRQTDRPPQQTTRL